MLHIANYSEFELYLHEEHFKTIASKIGAFLHVEDTKIIILTFTSFLFQSFSANTDFNTPVTITFPEPVRTQLVRIRPTSWNIWSDFRFDVLGCPGKKRKEVFPTCLPSNLLI